MKKYFISILFSAAIVSACNKILSKSGLIGKWKLTEYLADPGDGSGKWTPAQQPTTIEFTESGQVRENNKISASYKILSDSVLEWTSATAKVNTYYKIDGNQLYLHPPCIEACGEKYIRSK